MYTVGQLFTIGGECGQQQERAIITRTAYFIHWVSAQGNRSRPTIKPLSPPTLALGDLPVLFHYQPILHSGRPGKKLSSLTSSTKSLPSKMNARQSIIKCKMWRECTKLAFFLLIIRPQTYLNPFPFRLESRVSMHYICTCAKVVICCQQRKGFWLPSRTGQTCGHGSNVTRHTASTLLVWAHGSYKRASTCNATGLLSTRRRKQASKKQPLTSSPNV